MSKQIVFDGDFNEADAEWLVAEDDIYDYDNREKYSQRDRIPGPDEYTTIITYGRRDPDDNERAWIVVLEDGAWDRTFVIEGKVNYFRFITSPFVDVILMGLGIARKNEGA